MDTLSTSISLSEVGIYDASVGARGVVHGYGSVTTRTDDAQPRAFDLIGGEERSAIVDVRLQIIATATYPLLWMHHAVKVLPVGVVVELGGGQ